MKVEASVHGLMMRAWCPSAQEFLPRLYRDAHIECLIQGNVRLEDALDIAQKARAEFSDGVLTAAERPLDTVTRLSPGCSLLHRYSAAACIGQIRR